MSKGYECDFVKPIPKVFTDTVRALKEDEKEVFISYAENLEEYNIDISDLLSCLREEMRIPFIKATIASFK